MRDWNLPVSLEWSIRVGEKKKRVYYLMEKFEKRNRAKQWARSMGLLSHPDVFDLKITGKDAW